MANEPGTMGAENKNSKPVQEVKCPNCGAPMIFSAETGMLICEYCGTKVKPEQNDDPDQKISGYSIQELESQVMQMDAEDIPIYNCVSCGAEILAAKEEVSLTCPYCKNNIVLTEKVSGKMRPNAVIPFKISKKELPDALNRFYKDKVLLPKKFFSESTLGKVTGVYVPFWAFTGNVEGELTYRGEIVSKHREADYEVTQTAEYKLLRDISVSFKDLIIDASKKLDDAMMDSIEPFDLSEAKPFNMAYLAGYAAERFDVPAQSVEYRADKRMKNTALKAVAAKVGAGYSGVAHTGGGLKANMDEVKYMLLPVYVFSITYRNIIYKFAMNGQTGKVVGQVPTDKAVSRVYALKRLLAVLAVVMIISIILYFAGV